MADAQAPPDGLGPSLVSWRTIFIAWVALAAGCREPCEGTQCPDESSIGHDARVRPPRGDGGLDASSADAGEPDAGIHDAGSLPDQDAGLDGGTSDAAERDAGAPDADTPDAP